MSKSISIVTDWNSELGSGHVQRMASLLVYLNLQGDCNAQIINSSDMAPLPPELRGLVNPQIPSSTDLIIRDMRDSGVGEIKALRQHAGVMVIDDNGPGRSEADIRVDLLPNPLIRENNGDYRPDSFIYGYNFQSSIRDLSRTSVLKDIDISIYCGANPSGKSMDDLLALVPDNATIALLMGEDSEIIKNGKRESDRSRGYGEMILASRVLLSHFGITLYEGHISGCRLISLNPTQYHSDLADQATELDILNLGVAGQFDTNIAKREISAMIESAKTESITQGDVNGKILINLNNFHKIIKNELNC